MPLPSGLRRPHHIAELVPVLLALAVFAGGTAAYWIYIVQTARV